MAQAPVLATNDSNTVPYVGGFVCALITLLVLANAILGASADGQTEAVSGLALSTGDCADVAVGSDDSRVYRVSECTDPHDVQITGNVEHPDAGKGFPGERVMAVWFGSECDTVSAEFLGSDVLDTTLTGDFIMPTTEEWDDGGYSAACFVTTSSAEIELQQSVEDSWQDFARSEEVVISRLKAGDCFVSDLPDPRDLRSNDVVNLVECTDSFHGVFFGRGRLPFPAGSAIPVESELTDASTAACANEFEGHFGEVSTGFSYRFWRPSDAAWERGERGVLCAVLDNELIEGPYLPTNYPSFFNLDAMQCFNLTPELAADELSLDGRIRPVECTEPHVGQKIDIGTLLGGQEFPGITQVERDAQEACAIKFTQFIGIPPQDSEYNGFPFWHPDAETWEAGDRRYGCAILGDEILTDSLEGVRR